MVLAVPSVASAMVLASGLTLDTAAKLRVLRGHYSALGVQQLAVHVLHTTSTSPTSTDIVIDINGSLVTTTITKKSAPRMSPVTC